jgi:hypothetical protein
MQTSRDNEILKHFLAHHFATIQQIEKIYFRDVSSSYMIAIKRLNQLAKIGHIKPIHDIATNRTIYILNDKKVKPPSLHRIILLDLYSELVYNGYNIEFFKAEKVWQEGKYRSDGFVVFTINVHGKTYIYRFFIEVQLANHDPNLAKYDELFKTEEIKKEFNTDRFPDVILVSDANYKNTFNLKNTKVIQISTSLNQLSKILVK